LSLVKKDIVSNISNKAHINLIVSQKILESFLLLIKKNSHNVNISNFGTFYRHKTPKRIGRNPKNKKEYLIKSTYRLKFKASSSIKNIIN
jgi:nucleoid DNA-binding protein